MKKILVAIVALSIAFAFAACSSKQYVDTVVTQAVTDDNGVTVTDNKGNVVTEVVTTAAKANASSNKDNNSNSTKKGDTTKKGETTKKGSGTTKKSETTTKKKTTTLTTEKTTTAPANRYIKAEIQLPSNSAKEDTLIIYLNDKEVKKQKVTLNGSTVSFKSEDKYKGKVAVKVVVEKNGDSSTKTVKVGSDTVKFSLMGLEVVGGEDD